MNMLTLKWAELLTAWSLASKEERAEFQEKHGPVVEPPQLLNPSNMSRKMENHPVTHDDKGPVFFRDLDADSLRDGKLVRKTK
jgi:hypothetical protein